MPDITLSEKSMLATIILILAGAQSGAIVIARGWLFDASPRLRRQAVAAHRIGGYAGLVLILLIAYYCVLVIEATSSSSRTALHAILGAATVALVLSKVATARVFRKRYRLLPVLGGLLGAAIAATWATSALWYYINF